MVNTLKIQRSVFLNSFLFEKDEQASLKGRGGICVF